MSNDGRYLYHHNQGLHSPYDAYYHPPQSPYDTNSIQQHPTAQPTRPVRPSSTQSQSPSQQTQFNPSPSSPYPPSYPPASYMNHPPAQQPQQQQQWTGDSNWPQYSQSYHPPQPPVAPEPSFHSGPGRPDTSMSSSPASPRSYAPASLSAPTASPRREQGRQTPATQHPPHPSPPHQNQNRRPDTDPPAPVPAPRPGTSPTGLDFRKLGDAYKLILDTNSNYSNRAGPQPHGRAAPAMDLVSIERMLKAASFAAQMLDTAAHLQRVPPPPTTPANPPPVARSPKIKEPEPSTPKDSTPAPNSSSNKRQKTEKTEDAATDSQVCLGCGATSTPEWRRGPMGPRTLCNACGLVYAKLIKKRVKESTKTGKSNGQGNKSQAGEGSSAGGDSDDEDYTSR